MPKSVNTENPNGITTDNHSKKWFTKLSLKIPKKLKNGKNTSTLTTALNNAKKNSTLDSTNEESLNEDNQAVYDTLGETNSLSSNTLIAQPSQLSIDSVNNESTLNTSVNPPLICISSISSEKEDTNNTLTRNIDISNNTHLYNKSNIRKRPNGNGHRRTISDYISTPIQRPRSYSDTPSPIEPSVSYYDDDYLNDVKDYEIPENLRQPQFEMVKENYYHEKDIELYDKTPVITAQNTPNDTSNFPTPSNTITAKISPHHNTSVNTTPVLRNREIIASPLTSEDKYSSLLESSHIKSCDNMTAKEFALAVGIKIRSEDSDSEEEDDDDEHSICTLSSTLSQLTANGKVPTANEIYNALSVKSLNRQKRKHSAPMLTLDMFNPPAPGECLKSASSCHSFKSELNKCSQRSMGDLSHKISNPKLDRKLPLCVTSKSNESNLTCVASKCSYASSIHSSHSGNTTSYTSDIGDDDSYCSSTSYLQQSMNVHGYQEHNINKNNVATTFYSLPRVKLHASHATVSKPSNPNLHASNYNSYRDMGITNNRRHSRVSSTISINSQSSSVKKAPSSPNSFTHSPTLPSTSIHISHHVTKTVSNDSHNIYKTGTAIRTIRTPSPTNFNVYPTSSSWSNGLNEHENRRVTPKIINYSKVKTENKVEVYTKGRFTITHETYHQNGSTSSHVFEVEKN